LLPYFLNNIWNLSKEVYIGKPKNTDYYPFNSFRPIRLVSILVKLMEKVIFGHLILESYSHFKNWISGFQHFKEGRSLESTAHSILLKMYFCWDASVRGRWISVHLIIH
jgi:hypothetical protein